MYLTTFFMFRALEKRGSEVACFAGTVSTILCSTTEEEDVDGFVGSSAIIDSLRCWDSSSASGSEPSGLRAFDLLKSGSSMLSWYFFAVCA